MVSLELRDLSACYGGREVLAGITTPKLNGGHVVSLLGPNGAGKSTLFKRIFGLLKGAGEVRIEGAETPRPIAYMPQDDGTRPGALGLRGGAALADAGTAAAGLDRGSRRGRPSGRPARYGASARTLCW